MLGGGERLVGVAAFGGAACWKGFCLAISAAAHVSCSVWIPFTNFSI